MNTERNLVETRTVESEGDSRKGFLNPAAVRRISFWTISGCLLVAVVACLLAIWKFTGTDVLWRTVATCAVIGAGILMFYGINSIFGKRQT